MRKTSIVLIAFLVAFGMTALLPENTAIAAGGCGACRIGPMKNPRAAPYDNNIHVAYSTLATDGGCYLACQYCYDRLYCAACIDKWGCTCETWFSMYCKGTPQGYYCESPT